MHAILGLTPGLGVDLGTQLTERVPF